MTTIDRIFQYLDFKGYKYAPAEKKLGLSNGYLGKMKTRGASIGSEIIEKIVLLYKDINPAWLLTGEGTMLRVSDASGRASAPAQAVLPAGPCQQCELRDMIIAQQAKTIALLEDKITGTTGKPKPTLTHDDIR